MKLHHHLIIILFMFLMLFSCTSVQVGDYGIEAIYNSEGGGYLPAISFSPSGKYIALSGAGKVFLYLMNSN